MRAARDLHRTTTRLLSVAMLVLGLAMVVRAVTAGGGALAAGVVFGVLFMAAGAGRLWITRAQGRHRAR